MTTPPEPETSASPSAVAEIAAAPSANLARAALFMVMAAITLPAINACAKYLETYSVIQITWARYAGHFLFMVAVFAPAYGLAIVRSRRPSLQLLRSAFHCASAIFTFLALGMVALPTATAITFTAPLIVTALAPFLLGEKPSVDRIAAVVAGFVGTLIIVRPGFGENQNLATVLLLMNALAAASVQILSRKVATFDRPLTSNTYMVLIGFCVLTLPLPFVWRHPANTLDLAVFGLIGVFGGVGHYFLVSAFEEAPASFVAPFNYLQIIAAAGLGFLVFGQVPDVFMWVGSAVIAASGVFLLLRERATRPAAPKGNRRA